MSSKSRGPPAKIFMAMNERVPHDWLDLVLPPHTIHADESGFEELAAMLVQDTEA